MPRQAVKAGQTEDVRTTLQGVQSAVRRKSGTTKRQRRLGPVP